LAGATFRDNPQLSWKYFRKLELALRGKLPNIGHCAIAGLERPGRWISVATQNIDGLHQNAGSTAVIELHGNLRRLLCTRCDRRSNFETFEALAPVPRCPECSGIMRPDAVLYGEMLPEAALLALDCEQTKGFDLVFSVGTTSVFRYICQPIVIAARQGIPTVEINPEPTPISDLVQFRFAAAAGPVLRALQDFA
jgi:NAD-dependent deacetylase